MGSHSLPKGGVVQGVEGSAIGNPGVSQQVGFDLRHKVWRPEVPGMLDNIVAGVAYDNDVGHGVSHIGEFAGHGGA